MNANPILPGATDPPPNPHSLEYRNDDFEITIKAKMHDDTWHRIVHSVMQAIAKPIGVITFDGKLTAEEADELRRKWHERIRP